MALDKLGICNEAIGDLPSQPIESFDEGSVEAEWCARRYGPALRYLLERHDWKFPVTRETLALVTNDREGEWTYAYALPVNVASELRVFPSYAATSVDVPLLAGQRLAPTVAYFFPASVLAYSYLLSGGLLYTNVQDAVLEYVRDDPSEATFSALFERALSLEVAQRIAPSVLKGSAGTKRQRELAAMAEIACDRAIADARNRDPSESRYDLFENETQLGREGWAPGWGLDGYWVTR